MKRLFVARSFRIFLAAFLLCGVGMFVSLAVLLQNDRVLMSLERRIIENMEATCQARCAIHLDTISLLNRSVIVSNIDMHSIDRDNQWHIRAQLAQFSFSLSALLRTGTLAVALSVKELELFSHVKQKHLCIIKHFQPIFADGPQVFPFTLQSFSLQGAKLALVDKENNHEVCCKGDAVMKVTENSLSLHISLQDALVRYGHALVVTGLSGTIEWESNNHDKSICLVDSSFELFGLPGTASRCFLVGKWEGKEGECTIYNDDHSIALSRCIVKKEDEAFWIDFEGTIPLKMCMQAAPFSYLSNVSGKCLFSCKGDPAKNIKGVITLSDVKAGMLKIDKIETSFVGDLDSFTGSLCFYLNQELLVADWSWNKRKKEMKLLGINTTPVTFSNSGWRIPVGAMKLKGTFFSDKSGNFSHTFFIEHEKTEACCALSGKLHAIGLQRKYTGTFLTNHHEYEVIASSAPFLFTLREKDQKPSIEMAVKGSSFLVRVDTTFAQTILKEYFDWQMLSNGDIVCEGSLKNDFKMEATVSFKDGFMRIPGMYNFIESFHAQFIGDLLQKTGSFKDIKIGFKKGLLQSLCARGGYDATTQEWWAHVPFVFTDCLMNSEKDWYVWCSGAIVAEKMPGKVPSIRGFVTADKSHVKEHIFQQETQGALTGETAPTSIFSNVAIDLSCATQVPVAVKTAQLESQALAAVTCRGTIAQPCLEGAVVLQGGVIHFPAYSLAIVQGKLSFTGGPFNEPLIELVAQGRAKKYHITLLVGGTAQDPHIVFDAVPSLSQEQIMMLLLAGSEEESLNIVAPALIMRNIETIIFGSSYKTSSDLWAEGLRRIKFVPRFTNQTGRGGFKGVLEIEVSKKLRATIEKNFSLTEDVAFGFDYAIADDVSVQAGIDERGDLGAQVEMRFKF